VNKAAELVPTFSSRYIIFAMLVLLILNTINFMDRQVLNILAEPIKHDLRLADWQLGAMNGLAFAILYTTLGLPIARLAERRNRPFIIAACITVWSGFTALSGAANSFIHLCMARIGVGIGEAGCTPAATALIADMVPKHRRALSIAFFAMAAPLGGVVGLGLGGIFADILGWRAAFVLIGLLGIPVAILIALFIREPRRSLTRAQAAAAGAPSLAATIAFLRHKKTFWLITASTAGKFFIGYGHAAFMASFLLRNHAAQIADAAAHFHLKPVGLVGVALAVTTGPANMLGALVGGWLSDHLARTDARAYATVPALAMLLQLPLYVPAFLVKDAGFALILLTANAFLGTFYYGPSYAAIQGVAKPQMRATAVAIYGLITTLIGLGLGPLLIGALSDTLADTAQLGSGPGLKWALIASLVTYPLTFALSWQARLTIVAELEE
jgi:MFS family permease